MEGRAYDKDIGRFTKYHKYEKMVADRLVKLSEERQVIVFTHRLAFAQLLVSSIGEYNKAQSELETPNIIDCKQIELRNRPLGEPTEPTYHGALKMKNALILTNEKYFHYQEIYFP